MTVEAPDRELRLQVAYNVRHLGGYATRSGQQTRSIDIVRSASLHRLSDEGVEMVVEHGIRTVVDFRSKVERERDVTPDLTAHGIQVINAPVFEQDASPVALEHDFPGFATVYERMLEMGRPAYRSLFETLAEAPGGVLFHCAAGKDRTGVAAALALELAGVRDESILEDYSVSAALLSPLFAEWLPRMHEHGIDERRARQLMASNREDMKATLVHIRARWGSAEGYLEDIGLSLDAISAVRARLVA
jgi:protein-tyrosine phosphatase